MVAGNATNPSTAATAAMPGSAPAVPVNAVAPGPALLLRQADCRMDCRHLYLRTTSQCPIKNRELEAIITAPTLASIDVIMSKAGQELPASHSAGEPAS